ncbi:MAG: hypothetical protein ING75_13750 [Rhodocyclaceae bacterium]|nr:hypothetical protein [Rhodocyclaceae bacterium]
MKRVVDRIEHAPACSVIRLDEEEKRIYCGAGFMLARFVDAKLVELHDPGEVTYQSDRQAMATEAVGRAYAWIDTTEGEHWMVMCSSYELCEPRQLTIADPSAYASMANKVAERVINGLG